MQIHITVHDLSNSRSQSDAITNTYNKKCMNLFGEVMES